MLVQSFCLLIPPEWVLVLGVGVRRIDKHRLSSKRMRKRM